MEIIGYVVVYGLAAIGLMFVVVCISEMVT